MNIVQVDSVRIEGVVSALPAQTEDSLARCTALFGSAEKASAVVKTTGIKSRRLASAGMTPLDLCCVAAERLMSGLKVDRESVGAIVFVSFTSPVRMPASACLAQSRLGLNADVATFDLGLACSGYPYGLYLAATLAKAMGKRVLLLDGDVQSARLDAADQSTVPVLADAGSATLIAPCTSAREWKFAFHTNGGDAKALSLEDGGAIRMDGFGVYRFVATEVKEFLKSFLDATSSAPDIFVPHQANVYMCSQLAKSLGIDEARMLISADEVGNSASATIPVTLSRKANGRRGSFLLAGFGGGLSASAGMISITGSEFFDSIDCSAN